MGKTQKNPAAPFYLQMSHFERSMLDAALAATRWNRKAAARNLGISYRTLLYKIEAHQLKVSGFQSGKVSGLEPEAAPVFETLKP